MSDRDTTLRRRCWLLEQQLHAVESGDEWQREVDRTLEMERLLDERATEVQEMRDEVRSLRCGSSAAENAPPSVEVERLLEESSAEVNALRAQCAGLQHELRTLREAPRSRRAAGEAHDEAVLLRAQVATMAKQLVVRERQAAVLRENLTAERRQAAFRKRGLDSARAEAQQWWAISVQLQASLTAAAGASRALPRAPLAARGRATSDENVPPTAAAAPPRTKVRGEEGAHVQGRASTNTWSDASSRSIG